MFHMLPLLLRKSGCTRLLHKYILILTCYLIYQHLIYWDAIFLNSIPLKFDLSLIASQLPVHDAIIDLFFSQVSGLQCSGKKNFDPHKVLGLWNHYMGGKMHNLLDAINMAL